MVPAFISSVLIGEPPTIHGDGGQSRDFTYVTNVVDANLLAMTAPAERVVHGLFNIAAGGRHSVKDLYTGIRDLLESDVEAVHQESRAGDIRHSQADISRARDYLGYEPRVSFLDGLEKTVEYFKQAGHSA